MDFTAYLAGFFDKVTAKWVFCVQQYFSAKNSHEYKDNFILCLIHVTNQYLSWKPGNLPTLAFAVSLPSLLVTVQV